MKNNDHQAFYVDYKLNFRLTCSPPFDYKKRLPKQIDVAPLNIMPLVTGGPKNYLTYLSIKEYSIVSHGFQRKEYTIKVI